MHIRWRVIGRRGIDREGLDGKEPGELEEAPSGGGVTAKKGVSIEELDGGRTKWARGGVGWGTGVS